MSLPLLLELSLTLLLLPLLKLSLLLLDLPLALLLELTLLLFLLALLQLPLLLLALLPLALRWLDLPLPRLLRLNRGRAPLDPPGRLFLPPWFLGRTPVTRMWGRGAGPGGGPGTSWGGSGAADWVEFPRLDPARGWAAGSGLDSGLETARLRPASGFYLARSRPGRCCRFKRLGPGRDKPLPGGQLFDLPGHLGCQAHGSPGRQRGARKAVTGSYRRPLHPGDRGPDHRHPARRRQDIRFIKIG
ncbi:MAG TPA: hypothetical protein VE082_03235, partial [Desulfobaccales bacterium]|nr:hypothetical protein [Desulfobaccales bacterium]